MMPHDLINHCQVVTNRNISNNHQEVVQNFLQISFHPIKKMVSKTKELNISQNKKIIFFEVNYFNLTPSWIKSFLVWHVQLTVKNEGQQPTKPNKSYFLFLFSNVKQLCQQHTKLKSFQKVEEKDIFLEEKKFFLIEFKVRFFCFYGLFQNSLAGFHLY